MKNVFSFWEELCWFCCPFVLLASGPLPPIEWSMACRHAYQWQMGDGAGVFGERKRNQVHSGWDEAPVLLNPGATGRGREKQSRLQINTFTWETKMVALFFLPAVALRCTIPTAPFIRMLLWRVIPNAERQNSSYANVMLTECWDLEERF